MNMPMTEKIKKASYLLICAKAYLKKDLWKTLMYEFNHSHPSEVEKRVMTLTGWIAFRVQIMPDDFVMQPTDFVSDSDFRPSQPGAVPQIWVMPPDWRVYRC